MKQQIDIYSDLFSAVELRDLLANELSVEDETLSLQLWQRRRSLEDPTVLVAIVSGVSATISTLVSGLFRIIEGRQANDAKIVIRGSDGTTIEFFPNTSKAEREELIRLAKELNGPNVGLIINGKM